MYATFEGLGGEGGSTDPTSWSPTAKRASLAIGAVVVGGVLIAALAHANVCPKLQRLYSDNWLKYGRDFAQVTRRQAAGRGCAWALRDSSDVMRAGQG